MVTGQGDFIECAMMADGAFPDESIGEIFHGVLDIAGFIPGIGEAADLLNGIIYLAEGDLQNAAISAAAMIPVAGDAGKVVRLACSLTAETNVLMAGGVVKPISEIKIGDRVMTTDPDDGRDQIRSVTNIFVHEDAVVDLVTRGGALITTTKDHRFYNETDQAWQPISAFDPGDHFYTAGEVELAAVGFRSGSGATVQVFNLTVSEIHTYYVRVGGTFVLVHNDCGNFAHGIGQIADGLGYSSREVRDAIHAVKRQGMYSGERRNPDVVVDLDTGEVHMETSDGVSEDSIGNIFDFLPE